MDQTFLLKLVLSFVIGGIWITLSTMAAERFGSKIGGVLAGLPSTIIVSLFFIAWTQSPEVAAKATTNVPIIMGVDAFFIVVYALLRKFGFYLALFGALLFWGIAAIVLILFSFDSLLFSMIGFAVLVVIAYYIMELRHNYHSESRKYMKYNFTMILFRGLLSGSIIAFAVFMAKVSGPIIGGMFSAFPAVMISTIIITYFAHGTNFSFAVMKIIMVSGPVNVVAYALTARWLYPISGLILGTVLSFCVSLISTFFVYQFVRIKMK